mgnify:FL=1
MSTNPMDLEELNGNLVTLLASGASARDLLRLAAHYRRLELEQDLIRRCGGIVMDGPFQGIRHPGEAYGSTLCPKLLGTYERELSDQMLNRAQSMDCFLDIGCAEGFYTTGIACKTAIRTVIGVDISPEALAHAHRFADLNGVAARCSFTANLQTALAATTGRLLILIDVEGAELDVLTTIFAQKPNLHNSGATLIIETDYLPDGSSNQELIIQTLQANGFSSIEMIAQDVSCRFSALAAQLSTSLLDLTLYGLEGRPNTQTWLIACSDNPPPPSANPSTTPCRTV